MTVQFKFFMLPAMPDESAETEMNRFLRSVRVLTVQHEFMSHNGNAFWCFCVEYLLTGSSPALRSSAKAGKKPVDYKDVLSAADFAVFAKLREWRKEAAAKEAIPVYTIFTNEQLAQISRNRPDTLSALKKIDGVGEARAAKYGQFVIALINPEPAPSAEDGA